MLARLATPAIALAMLLAAALPAPTSAAVPGLAAERRAFIDTLPLPESVRRDLATRDPSEIEYSDHLLASRANFNSSEGIVERAAPNGLNGIQTRGTASRSFAFTFDDGPYTSNTNLVNQFKARGARATFAVNGANFNCIYDEANVKSLRYALASGMDICSHGWGHLHSDAITLDQLRRQVLLVEDALWKILGVVPACFRPPYGELNAERTKLLNDMGYVVVNWNADTQDAGGQSVSYGLQQYRKFVAPKHGIILNHETVSTTPTQLVPKALDYILGAGGYKPANVMTVSQALGFNPYKVRGKPGVRDASWTCAGKPAPGQP